MAEFADDMISFEPPIHSAMYVNYGIEELEHNPDLLRWHMDTWYYSSNDHVGHWTIGVGAVTAQAGMPSFLVGHIAASAVALTPFGRARPTLRIGHAPTLGAVRAYVADFSADDLAALLPNVQNWLQQQAGVVTFARMPFDLELSVRTFDGGLTDAWFPNAGFLQYQAHYRDRASDRLLDEQQIVWEGSFWLNVFSLFVPDNEPKLDRARAFWRQLRAQDPTIDLFPAESELDQILTLDVVPLGTPPDNRALSERNLPRLVQAIDRLEAATGQPFLWDVAIHDR